MDANKKWLSISKEMRSRLIENVWCGNCLDETTIVGFIVEDDKYGIVLKGRCKNCGQQVARVVEIE